MRLKRYAVGASGQPRRRNASCSLGMILRSKILKPSEQPSASGAVVEVEEAEAEVEVGVVPGNAGREHTASPAR